MTQTEIEINNLLMDGEETLLEDDECLSYDDDDLSEDSIELIDAFLDGRLYDR